MYQPGSAQLARMAKATSPSSRMTTAAPVCRSVATAAKGMGSSSKRVTGKRSRT
jgi:hypothetical protein